MRKKIYNQQYCLLIALFCFLTTLLPGSATAQLASWKPAGSTDFPIFRSGIWYDGMCRISQFIFDPNNPRTMLAVSAQGGLYKTTDEGLNWVSVPGMENNVQSCASICIDRTNSNTIFVGTGDPDYYSVGDGVWKSTDGGITFSQSGLNGQLVVQIIQDPVNPSCFAAATSSGIFKSFDNGQTWTQSLLNVVVGGNPTTVPLSGIFTDMKKNADPSSRVLYAATAELVSVFYRSTDFGDHWEKITNGITSVPVLYILNGGRIGVTKADPNRVYLFSNGGLGMVYMSADGGNSFQVRKPEGPPNLTGYLYGNNNFNNGQANYNSAFYVDNSNPDRIWYYAHSMTVSEDGGLTYTLLHPNGDGIHTDAKMFAQSPDDPDKLWASNDGGIWFSNNKGVTWLPRSNGLYAYEIGWNAGKGSRTRSDLMQIGTQDNGCISMNDYKWYGMWTGDDYFFREFDYLPEGGNIYYPGVTNSRLTADNAWGQDFGVPIPMFHDIIFNRKERDLCYIQDSAEASTIYRTLNLSSQSPAWSQVTSLPAKAVAMNSPIADPDRLYILTREGTFYASMNARSANPVFTQLAMPVPYIYVASIASIANDANKIYMAINEKVFYSNDGGNTWQDITYNLPVVFHRRILAEDYGGSSELVFIATSNAVYYKKAGQTSWTIYSTGLPGRRGPTDFSMYDDSTSHSRIRYTSFGRGIYETGFDNLRPLGAIIDLPDSSVLSCTSNSIQVRDASNGKLHLPVTYSWSFPGGSPSSSTEPAPVVTYPATGTYSISLTITDALNNQSTTTVNRFIQKYNCSADTVPGRALQPDQSRSYVLTDPIDLDTSNTLTISAWVKTSQVQRDYTGIMTINFMTPCGLILQDNNKIGFIWEGQYHQLESGLVLPADNKWHHVAVSIGPDKASVYLDGFPSTFTGLVNNRLKLNASWSVASFDQMPERNFLGQIDEVCLYTRELSTAEIREQMNLTKNNRVIDPSLKMYYQFNEYGRTVFNKAGPGSARMIGNTSLVRSTAPVGGGVAQTIPVTAGGPVLFDRAGIELDYSSSGTIPNGPVVATRLHVSPDDSASVYCLPDPKLHYWIVRSYGTNANPGPLNGVVFSPVAGISTIHSTNPASVQLYKREANADGHTWGDPVAAARSVSSNGGAGSIHYASGLPGATDAQYMTGSALPVKHLELTGLNENNLSALLNWTVAGERTGVSYTLEHRTGGAPFAPLTSMPGTGAASYQHRHLYPPAGLNDYRVAVKDINNRITYSNTVTLKFEAVPLKFVLAPVPAENTVALSLNRPAGMALELKLMNAAGQLLKTIQLTNGTTRQEIGMERYSSGLYLLVVYNEKGEQLYKKRFSKIQKAP